MTLIKDNLAAIQAQISQACKLSNRESNEVTLLAVSKTKPNELIEQAYVAGQRDFGESYVQESIEKVAQLSHLSDICWHFIGPIQSNKTRQIAENFSWVHGVDRIKIATRLNEQREVQDNPLNVCLQINISNENNKSGVLTKDLPELAHYVNNCDNLVLRGLMAIPEKNASAERFDEMQRLFLDLKQTYPQIDTLSMGMSGDMKQAIMSGSTMVRVGTAIFGARA
ncbi:YggS family pyridoxal phosphate-dependent enzyme [Pseudocolwellia sp. AS88]|jgi:pyridoxal phosphate enzyme (YggS family)|uniref:YggS family pyridoxal phosphate-dependent enzyme n=1 Tax=Pseudocolwellia TaxID=2848177 RepID=UPI0026EFB8C5|nr:YggS family pyridoxal phosphate-dependent enzyme [Pseudocolwellia sp. AS88]MDO7086669.1 YggS family pyridoxal phosphate-dependent enzyme [Pseudocolwellia sp. AS88]